MTLMKIEQIIEKVLIYKENSLSHFLRISLFSSNKNLIFLLNINIKFNTYINKII